VSRQPKRPLLLSWRSFRLWWIAVAALTTPSPATAVAMPARWMGRYSVLSSHLDSSATTTTEHDPTMATTEAGARWKARLSSTVVARSSMAGRKSRCQRWNSGFLHGLPSEPSSGSSLTGEVAIRRGVRRGRRLARHCIIQWRIRLSAIAAAAGKQFVSVLVWTAGIW